VYIYIFFEQSEHSVTFIDSKWSDKCIIDFKMVCVYFVSEDAYTYIILYRLIKWSTLKKIQCFLFKYYVLQVK